MESHHRRNPLRVSKNHSCVVLHEKRNNLAGQSCSRSLLKQRSDHSIVIHQSEVDDCYDNEATSKNTHVSRRPGMRCSRANICSRRGSSFTSKPLHVPSELEASTDSDDIGGHRRSYCSAHLQRSKSACGRHFERAENLNSSRNSAADLRVTTFPSRQRNECAPSQARKALGGESRSSKSQSTDSSIENGVACPHNADVARGFLKQLCAAITACSERERANRSVEPCCGGCRSEVPSGMQAVKGRDHRQKLVESTSPLLMGKRDHLLGQNEKGPFRLSEGRRLENNIGQLPKGQEGTGNREAFYDRLKRRHNHPVCANWERSFSDLEDRRKQPSGEDREQLPKIPEGQFVRSSHSLKPRMRSGSKNVDGVFTLLSPRKARVYATERVLETVIDNSKGLYVRENAVAGHMHFIESPGKRKEDILLCAQPHEKSQVQIPDKFKSLGHKRIGSERKTSCVISAESEHCLKEVYQRSLATFKMLESQEKKQKSKVNVQLPVPKKATNTAPSKREKRISHDAQSCL